MKKMLVLLNHPEEIESHLWELREIAKTHGIANIYLAKIVLPFGSRIRSRVAPHKLDLAAQMSDEADSKYLSTMADTLSKEGIEAQPIGAGIPVEEVEEYIKKNNIDLVVTGNGRSGLSSWPVQGLTGGSLQSIYGYGLTEEPVAFERRKARVSYRVNAMTGFVMQFGALFLFWLILSGHYRLKYILFGVASAGLVTLLTNDAVSVIFRHEEIEDNGSTILKFLRFLAYMPWLLYQIIKANIQVASIVLDPKLPIDPVMLQFSTTMKRKVAQVILATSITLTPGTVTISLDNGKYTIHALLPAAAQDLVEANMQRKVAEIFKENKERPPDTLWAHSIKELAL